MNKFHGDIQTIVYRYLYHGVISELLEYSDSSQLLTSNNRFKVTSKYTPVMHPFLAIRKCENECGKYIITNTYIRFFHGVGGMCWACNSKKQVEKYLKNQFSQLRYRYFINWLFCTTIAVVIGVLAIMTYEYLRNIDTNLNVMCKIVFIAYCLSGAYQIYSYHIDSQSERYKVT